MLLAVQRRERQRLFAAMRGTSGLIPLLMKQRNGQQWSEEDRRYLREQLLTLKEISPYLIVLIAPGGFFMMPVLAWWLDRRRQRRSEIAKTETRPEL